MADIANPDLFACVCRTWIRLDISRFLGRNTSHPVGPHDWLAPENVIGRPLLGGGRDRHDLHRVCQTTVTAFHLSFSLSLSLCLSHINHSTFYFYRLYSLVRLSFSLSMFITYGLQFYVPVYIIWDGLKKVASVQWYQVYGEFLLRVLLVLITCK